VTAVISYKTIPNNDIIKLISLTHISPLKEKYIDILHKAIKPVIKMFAFCHYFDQ